MDGLELVIQELKEESASTPDYRQTVDKFQVLNAVLLLLK